MDFEIFNFDFTENEKWQSETFDTYECNVKVVIF